MATPSGKNNHNPGATPTQFTSSPFPSAVPMGRPLSHKSPPIRTPSASGQHHQNHPSTSSYQYPTPLAAAASAEDAATFSSPSALLALGLGGITPSLSGNDGLVVGQGINENGIQGLGIPSLNMSGPRDSEAEKRKNLQEVLRLLRQRITGRGVCREGVERLGKLEGLECLWQEDILSIAGNFVDLEIEFLPGKEYVKDVILRYATPEAEEGEKRVEATEVLKRNLIQTPEEQAQGLRKKMDAFHTNLRQLARMDHLSQEVNCFQAIEGLHESLNRIWEEECRDNPPPLWQHVRSGPIGRPWMHAGDNVGLSLQYWVRESRFLDSRQAGSEERMDVDHPESKDCGRNQEQENLSVMVIECEEGYPSLRVSKEWVASPALTTSSDTEAGEIKVVNWLELQPTLISNPGSMDIDATPHRRFVARLDPPIDMPIVAVSETYRIVGRELPPEYKLTTYDNLLFPLPTTAASQGVAGEPADKLPPATERRKQRELCIFDSEGRPVARRHEYTFHAFEQVPGRTICELPFSHPRQLSEVIPILRQYAFLSSLLRSLFAGSDPEPEKDPKPEPATNSSMPTFLSNSDPTASKLDNILSEGLENPQDPNIGPSRLTQRAPDARPAVDLKIDVSLRTPMSASPPCILLLFTPAEEGATSTDTAQPVTVRIDINQNGRINVSDVSGLWATENDTLNKKTELEKLCCKLSKVLETCEDLGMFAEWLLRWNRRRKQSTAA